MPETVIDEISGIYNYLDHLRLMEFISHFHAGLHTELRPLPLRRHSTRLLDRRCSPSSQSSCCIYMQEGVLGGAILRPLVASTVAEKP